MNNEIEIPIIFDEKAFMTEKFEPRTKNVPAPELKAFFGEFPAEFMVRGLTASELSAVLSADSRNKILSVVLDKITGTVEDRADAILDQLGIKLDGDVPGDVIQQIETATISAFPQLSRSAWVRIARTHPIILKRVYLVAMEMTGMGQLVKKKPS